MAEEQQKYLLVLRASYDYEPQADAEDEIAIKENQLLFLLERTDDECDCPICAPSRGLTTCPVGGRSKLNLSRRTRRDLRASFPLPTSSPYVLPRTALITQSLMNLC